MNQHSLIDIIISTEFEPKTAHHLASIDNFDKCWTIITILSLIDSAINLQQILHHGFNHTLNLHVPILSLSIDGV